MKIDPRVVLGLTVFISVLVILGFAAACIWGIVATWQAQDTPPAFPDAFVYLSTALAGLVGGLVAAGFGQKMPEADATLDVSGAPAPPQPSRAASRALGVGAIVFPGQKQDWQQLVGSIYAIVYVLVGLATIVTWVLQSDVCPPMVKNLASVSIGLFLPIARNFLTTD
jgi:heme A synthase